jgi:hypothetical protein
MINKYFPIKSISCIEKLIEKGWVKKLDCINNEEYCKSYTGNKCKETCVFAKTTYESEMRMGIGSRL